MQSKQTINQRSQQITFLSFTINIVKDFCIALYYYFKSVICSQAEIEAVMDKICDRLPGDFGKKCEALIPVVLNVLENDMDPETVCTFLKMCSNETGNHGDFVLILKLLLGAFKYQMMLFWVLSYLVFPF